jgi:hypothetical protein
MTHACEKDVEFILNTNPQFDVLGKQEVVRMVLIL